MIAFTLGFFTTLKLIFLAVLGPALFVFTLLNLAS